jgi:hypothetical protein
MILMLRQLHGLVLHHHHEHPQSVAGGPSPPVAYVVMFIILPHLIGGSFIDDLTFMI